MPPEVHADYEDEVPAAGEADPSGIWLRFPLLILAMIVAALGGGAVWQTPEQGLDSARYSGCVNAVAVGVYNERHSPLPGVTDVYQSYQMDRAVMTAADWAEIDRRVARCPHPSAPLPGQNSAVVIGVLAGLAVLTYWVLPYWRIRWRGLVPLCRAGQSDALVGELREMAATAGVRVLYYVHPTDDRAEGVAFGHVGCRMVELKSGMLMMYRRDRPGFRAIIEHELGHIRHRDLDAAYLTVALWRAFAVLLLVVAVFFGADLGRPGGLAPNVTYLIALILVVYLARNGVLRAREYHADAFAARTPAGKTALVRLLDANATATSLRARLTGTHPIRQHRTKVLRGTTPLRELGRRDATALGMLIVLAVPVLPSQGSSIFQYWAYRSGLIGFDAVSVRPWFPVLALPLLVPVGAALAIAVSRAVWQGMSWSVFWWLTQLGLALSGGLLLGAWVAPDDSPLANRGLVGALAGAGIRNLGAVGLMCGGVGTVLVLTVASLAWWRPVAAARTRRWTFVLASYGAVLAVAWFPGTVAFVPGSGPVTAAVLLGFPLVGVVVTATRRLATARRQSSAQER